MKFCYDFAVALSLIYQLMNIKLHFKLNKSVLKLTKTATRFVTEVNRQLGKEIDWYYS